MRSLRQISGKGMWPAPTPVYRVEMSAGRRSLIFCNNGQRGCSHLLPETWSKCFDLRLNRNLDHVRGPLQPWKTQPRGILSREQISSAMVALLTILRVLALVT